MFLTRWGRLRFLVPPFLPPFGVDVDRASMAVIVFVLGMAFTLCLGLCQCLLGLGVPVTLLLCDATAAYWSVPLLGITGLRRYFGPGVAHYLLPSIPFWRGCALLVFWDLMLIYQNYLCAKHFVPVALLGRLAIH